MERIHRLRLYFEEEFGYTSALKVRLFQPWLMRIRIIWGHSFFEFVSTTKLMTVYEMSLIYVVESTVREFFLQNFAVAG